MLRVILVDDEAHCRLALRQLLMAYPDIEICAELSDPVNVPALLSKEPVDALFLDVEMPGMSGYDLLPQLPPHVRVIMVTAHSAYAARGFDEGIFDFLVKPVDPARVAKALDRIRKAVHAEMSATPTDHPNNRLQGNSETNLSQGSRLHNGDAAISTSAAASTSHSEARLFLRTPKGNIFLRIDDIRALKAEGDYTVIYQRHGSPILACHSISWLQDELPPGKFTRVERSISLPLALVVRVQSLPNRSSRLWLEDMEEPLILGRTASSRLRKKLDLKQK